MSGGPARSWCVESIVSSVELLSPEAVQGLVMSTEVFEFFERWGEVLRQRAQSYEGEIERTPRRDPCPSHWRHATVSCVRSYLHVKEPDDGCAADR